jgi:hypothetical protein
MTRFSRMLFLAILFAGVVFGAPRAKADPPLFSNVVALQNNGSTRVDLFSNPGVSVAGPEAGSLVDITGELPAGVSNTLSITYLEAGSSPLTQSFLIPAR